MMKTVYAMPGTCHIPLQLPTPDAAIMDWYVQVQKWGKGRNEELTKDCIIAWGWTMFKFGDREWAEAERFLEEFA